MLHVLRKELSAIREYVVCHTNLEMDFVSPYYKAGYDIIVSLFSCLNKKHRLDPRLALRHKPNLGRFNTRRRKLENKIHCENNLRRVPKNLPIATAYAETVAPLIEYIYYT